MRSVLRDRYSSVFQSALSLVFFVQFLCYSASNCTPVGAIELSDLKPGKVAVIEPLRDHQSSSLFSSRKTPPEVKIPKLQSPVAAKPPVAASLAAGPLWSENDSNQQTSGLQLMPAGLMYHSYLAGPKEPRFNAVWLKDQNGKLNWETQLGGRCGVLRYGDFTPINPNGWQLDIEGGAQARVLPDDESDLEAADFRVGILLTQRSGLWSTKTGYYHLSSHVGDEFLIKNPGFTRINYVRDAMIFGLSRDLLWNGRPDFRCYGETAYAFSHEFGSPWEFQTGAEYSPLVFNGLRGSPFFAVNGQFRQDRSWDAAGLSIVTGWQWRSQATNQRFRVGLQYYDGDSLQWSFAGQKESSFGLGMWFDY